MSQKIVRVLSPEEDELNAKRAELAALEEQLASEDLAFSILKLEIDSFHRRYTEIIGALLAHLDDIHAKIATIELLLAPYDETLKQAATQAREKAEKSYRNSHDILQEQPKPQPSEDLKKLYWEVAHKIHPDLCNDERDRERCQKLMVEANVAFEAGDEAGLRKIMRGWKSRSPGNSNGNLEIELARIKRQIADVKSAIKEIRREVDTHKISEIFILRMNVEAASKYGQDLLEDMAKQINCDIGIALRRLDALKEKLNSE